MITGIHHFFVIEKVVSPVVLVVNSEKKQYENGKAAAAEQNFIVESICAEGGTIVVKGKYAENTGADMDWIKEQVQRTGVEPNLFDGV